MKGARRRGSEGDEASSQACGKAGRGDQVYSRMGESSSRLKMAFKVAEKALNPKYTASDREGLRTYTKVAEGILEESSQRGEPYHQGTLAFKTN